MNDSSRYPDSIRIEMHRFVPPQARRLLDVGCHTGAFGYSLKQMRDVEIWGVEPASGPAGIAATRLDRVLTEPIGVDSKLPEGCFDVIVFNDVLEHIEAPWQTLILVRRWLTPNGVIVISLPNLLHVENFEHMLLRRDFCYEVRGARDRTHLRFFTRKSALRMFDECGYSVTITEGINEAWWTPLLVRRLVFKLFAHWLDEFKPQQFAFVLQSKIA